MNPYTSSGSVATMTANVSGNDNLNDLGDGPRQPGDPERYPVGAVTRRLLGYVRPHRISFVASFVSAAISVILQLYTPILIGEGIDLIVAAGQVDFDALLPLVTKLALVVVGAASFQWLQGYCVNRLSYETVRDMRVEASDKLSRMPLSFIDSHAHGDLMSRVVNDVDQVGDGLLQGFTQLFTGVITIVGTLAFMLSINLTMTLVVVLVTPLSIFAAGAIAKLSNKSFTAQQRIQGQLGGHIEEYVGEQKLVDAFAYGPNAQARFDDHNAEHYTAGERAQFIGSLSNPGTRFINNIIYAVVAVIGCVGVITGVPAALTVGGVQIFLSYANQYTKPFNEVTNVITQIQTAYASARRMFALLDARERLGGVDAAAEAALDVAAVLRFVLVGAQTRAQRVRDLDHAVFARHGGAADGQIVRADDLRRQELGEKRRPLVVKVQLEPAFFMHCTVELQVLFKCRAHGDLKLRGVHRAGAGERLRKPLFPRGENGRLLPEDRLPAVGLHGVDELIFLHPLLPGKFVLDGKKVVRVGKPQRLQHRAAGQLQPVCGVFQI